MTTAGTSSCLAPQTHFCGPLSLSLRHSSSSSLALLLLLPPSFLKIATAASNLRLPLSLSLSRQAHFPSSLLIAASLSSDSASLRHFPSPPASSSFCCLPASEPLSPYRSLLSAFPPSTFQTLPLFALHFNLISYKTQIDAERERKCETPAPCFWCSFPAVFSNWLSRPWPGLSKFHICRLGL